MVEYKACGLDDLIVHGLKALKDTLQQEKKLGVDNVTVAYVGKDQEFVIVEGDALEPWLSRIDQTVPETVVEEMQVDEAAGDAMEE
jgi:20S proteasome subunit alpha 6